MAPSAGIETAICLSTSGLEYRGAENLSAPQLVQDIVGFSERKRGRPGPDSNPWRDLQEIDAVLAREIGHRNQLPLFPEQMIGKARDIAHVNARADYPAALAHRAQRRRHQFPGRSIDDGGVERG